MIKEFLKPTTIEEAVLMKNSNQKATYIAGGTWINTSYSTINPEVVVSVANLGLNKVETKDNTIKIGAYVTMQELIDNQEVPEVLKEAARHVGSRNIRNMATIGGSISACSPWFSLTPAMLVLSATVLVHDGKNEIKIPLDEYLIRGMHALILGILIEKKSNRFACVQKYSRTARTVPVIVASTSLVKQNNFVTNPIIAIGGISNRIVRLYEVEKELENKELPQIDVLEKLISSVVNPKGDFRGSAELRKYMAGVLAASCLIKNYNNEGAAQ